jgi:hypothetical protein
MFPEPISTSLEACMTYRIALPVLALILAGACSGKDATAPTAKLAPSAASADRESARSGYLHAIKNCEGYAGLPGQSCTLTSTNLKQIPAGTKVVYTSGLGAGVLESAITLYPPDNNGGVAIGHVSLNLATKTGTAWITGGSGVFKHFRATVAIAYVSGRNWTWDGPYTFVGGKPGDEDNQDN